ncbi:MAG: hypothetical protein HC933_14960 [Pleurocapsa sp. SU_196_0]|nr:hypothetical protein [Pleurocapsa sp. SU_196_0]
MARRIYETYRSEYESLFGAMPDLRDLDRFPTQRDSLERAEVRAAWDAMRPTDQQTVLRVFTNAGKAIAAYERLLRPAAAPFDQYAESLLETNDPSGLTAISADAQAGLKLFVGKANCVQCHSNALLSDNNFYNTGVGINRDLGSPDPGRAQGLSQLERSGFTCLSAFSDAPTKCEATRTALSGVDPNSIALNNAENTATVTSRLYSSSNSPDDVVEVAQSSPLYTKWLGAFKTPGLRNVARTAPYMHSGQIRSLALVAEHYNRAPAPLLGVTQIKPLNLNAQEISQLVAFLNTLNSGVDAPAKWLEAPR